MEAPGRVARRVGKRLPIGAGREPQAIYVELLMAAPPWLVLVADDMQDARDIYASYLEARGFRAVTARDGEQAVEVATSERPDVIVMDLTMPKMDGIEATRRIKRILGRTRSRSSS